MFAYYLDLALRSFKRNKVLTALMVLALALGIGACITTRTVLKLLSGDPLPQKSARIFTPELNPLTAHASAGAGPAPVGDLVTYMDAMSLLHAHKAQRQAAMALTGVKISPREPNESPFFSNGVMTTADFFPMFDVPFLYGDGWTAQAGQDAARVAVIGQQLNDKLFGGHDSVGQTIRINDHDYRIIGVLRQWAPQPHFYSVNLSQGSSYGKGDAVFMPLRAARADRMGPETVNCFGNPTNNLETDPCAWLSVWVGFAHPSDAKAYKAFLANYVDTQVAAGRFHLRQEWLPNLTRFLSQQQVVPGDARLEAYLAFGFLLICVVGTVGLLLAKCLGRSREIGVRRALGASRAAIFSQFMIESGIVGLAGGALGLFFAEFGLWEVRHEPAQYAHLAHLDPAMFGMTFAVAIVAGLIAGVLPAWRACTIAPAPVLQSV
ncbi:ABC transporter permease [Dyella sp.]|jgi:putative ABC transport system permease protein|uniref:ABC transporter permease n=1 Tax=Dyella sp. TaxID=1869338 RepID=UPI002D786366|nr:ABC transporter permease [Dyella sp.]HET7333144.1 ABC transporter permease [Dyella sp.]